MKLLNLGCGYRYHEDWTNVDFISTGPAVISYDLKKGIPFSDKSFDVVYHSHVLEHFSKEKGKEFVKECYRVLNTDGILRIVVPDLEQIVKIYLEQLQQALSNVPGAAANYDWILLELYDQTVRNFSGGEMGKYLRKKELLNESFIYSRLGAEARGIRDPKSFADSVYVDTRSFYKKVIGKLKRTMGRFFFGRSKLLHHIFTPEELSWMEIGKFRSGGEIHQWMYDRYSLYRLLQDVGFSDVKVKNAFESSIPQWELYGLDYTGKEVHKPDSLFIEAIKK